ncbi:hypothetical protein GM3708_3617 (plasmid) [Geminocystis sp. NIES-3708]|uniref:hypothetical protein n=1 Tax=Geminocystis sp. NIES-3708 TaxID=1615909 RepID=UPI0005FC6B76|nr:hypothetical protein [Geminocystis sp. NIES-3708]BAQ63211.1 hypothetical protein GM3708_3617 [Geminocystis sp. NIES-3708]
MTINKDYFWTLHTLDNLQKRLEIQPLWIFLTLNYPDFMETVKDKIYYYKKITDFEGRVLKVVVSDSIPQRIITIHFHRGLKGKI